MSDLVLPNYQVINPPNTVTPRHAGSTATHAGSTDTNELEQVQFSFQKIDVTFSQDGASCSDDWTTGDGTGGGSGPHHHKHGEFVPHLISLPLPQDVATGHTSGKRQWKPFRLVVPVDGTVQKLLKLACAGKSAISSIVVTKGSPGGTRIKLTDVRVIKCLPHVGPSGNMGDALAFLIGAIDFVKLGYPAHDSWLTT